MDRTVSIRKYVVKSPITLLLNVEATRGTPGKGDIVECKKDDVIIQINNLFYAECSLDLLGTMFKLLAHDEKFIMVNPDIFDLVKL